MFYMKILRYQFAGIQTIALEMEMKAFFLLYFFFFRFSDNFFVRYINSMYFESLSVYLLAFSTIMVAS